MSKLISDRAQVKILKHVQEYLRVIANPAWQLEPYQQHQNYAECRIQHLKQCSNTIMDQHGAPMEMWLEALCYVAYLLNHTWSDNIKDVLLSALTGITVDISVLVCFYFWQQV